MDMRIEQRETLQGSLRNAFINDGPTAASFHRAEAACIVAGWSQAEVNAALDHSTRRLASLRALSRLYAISRDYGPGDSLDAAIRNARSLGISLVVMDAEIESGRRSAASAGSKAVVAVTQLELVALT